MKPEARQLTLLLFVLSTACSQGTRSFELERIKLGLSITEVTRIHPGSFQTQNLQLQGRRFTVAAAKSLRGWTDLTVQGTEAGVVNEIVGTRIAPEVGWTDVRSRLEAVLGSPDSERSDARGEDKQTVVTWGNASLVGSGNRYGDIAPQFSCSGRCAVASYVEARGDDFVQVTLRDSKDPN
jgi:hypothetical protein